MHTRLFDEDPITGVRTLWHWDAADERATLETQFDIEPVVELNKLEHRQYDERSTWKGDFHKVAQIPLPIYFDLKKRGIIDDKPAFAAWLNDRDNLLFRTRPGRV